VFALPHSLICWLLYASEKQRKTLKKYNCYWSNFFFVLNDVSEQVHSKIFFFFGQLFICKLDRRLLCDVCFNCLVFLSEALKITLSTASIKKQAE